MKTRIILFIAVSLCARSVAQKAIPNFDRLILKADSLYKKKLYIASGEAYEAAFTVYCG